MAYSADLHLHSSYAYACSKNLTLENLAAWAKVKGIDLLASADFTHPEWREELRREFTPDGSGFYAYKGTHFVLGTEVSCVYRQGGKGRRVHLLLLVPDFDSVDRISYVLEQREEKLGLDGRPTLKMSARDFTQISLEASSQAIIIPAHVWTPWFGVFGSKSGFDSLEECFQDTTPLIHCVETGLSSDPAMLWPVPELASKTIVSFSDAHSVPKLGRELTVFDGEFSYSGLAGSLASQRVAYTVEFYPEEGKYHLSGHRKCGIRQTPAETHQQGALCPVCRRPLTLGVLHQIATRFTGPPGAEDGSMDALGPRGETAGPGDDGFVHHPQGRPPFVRLVPLVEIIADVWGRGPATKGVSTEYGRLTQELGSELQVLLNAKESDLIPVAGESLSRAILSVRAGNVEVDPGYDGVYGRIKVSRSPI